MIVAGRGAARSTLAIRTTFGVVLHDATGFRYVCEEVVGTGAVIFILPIGLDGNGRLLAGLWDGFARGAVDACGSTRAATLEGEAIQDLDVDPTGLLVVAVSRTGLFTGASAVFRSLDGGASFTRLAQAPETAFSTVGIAPSNLSRLWLTARTKAARTVVYRSDDGGKTLVEVTALPRPRRRPTSRPSIRRTPTACSSASPTRTRASSPLGRLPHRRRRQDLEPRRRRTRSHARVRDRPLGQEGVPRRAGRRAPALARRRGASLDLDGEGALSPAPRGSALRLPREQREHVRRGRVVRRRRDLADDPGPAEPHELGHLRGRHHGRGVPIEARHLAGRSRGRRGTAGVHHGRRWRRWRRGRRCGDRPRRRTPRCPTSPPGTRESPSTPARATPVRRRPSSSERWAVGAPPRRRGAPPRSRRGCSHAPLRARCPTRSARLAPWRRVDDRPEAARALCVAGCPSLASRLCLTHPGWPCPPARLLRPSPPPSWSPADPRRRRRRPMVGSPRPASP